MEFVLTSILIAGVVTLVASLCVPTSRTRQLAVRLAERRSERNARRPRTAQAWTADAGQDRDDDLVVESYLYSRPFLRRRMVALTEELDRLDRDPGVFALAFLTMAARCAYEALRADAERLGEEPRRQRGPALELGYVNASGGSREEIQL